MVFKMTALCHSEAKPKNLKDRSFTTFRMTILIILLIPAAAFAWSGEKKEGVSPAEMEHLKGAKYVGSETCSACHEVESKEFKHSTHARVSLPVDAGEIKPGKVFEVQNCEMCHGPASLHVDEGGGKKNILNPKKDMASCFQCHSDKKMEFRLPHHHPVMEGKMNCTSCHSPHGPDVKPWTATSLKGTNEACFNCHKEQRGPFVFEHEAVREGCTTCHQVHGSLHPKMLVARDNNLCLRCHTQMNFPTVGKQAHGGRFPTGTCFTAGCHTAVHGSNFDDHLRY